MKISSAFPSTYLKAADLQGRNVTVTMSHVEMEEVGGDHKPVLYFQGKDRGLCLNKTNANNIVTAYGDDTGAWAGQQIVLFPAWVDYQGKSVEAIRVRPPQSKDHNAPIQEQASPPQNGGHQDVPTETLDDEIPF